MRGRGRGEGELELRVRRLALAADVGRGGDDGEALVEAHRGR